MQCTHVILLSILVALSPQDLLDGISIHMHRQLPMSTVRSSNLGLTTSTLAAAAATSTTTVPPSPSDVDDVFYPDRSMTSILPPIRGRGGGGGGGGRGVVDDWFANEARRRGPMNDGFEWDVSRRNRVRNGRESQGGGGDDSGRAEEPRGREREGEERVGRERREARERGDRGERREYY